MNAFATAFAVIAILAICWQVAGDIAHPDTGAAPVDRLVWTVLLFGLLFFTFQAIRPNL